MTRLCVITGDHKKTDPTKHGAAYGPEDLKAHARMVEAFESVGRYDLTVISDHTDLFAQLRDLQPDLVVNFCDTGLNNVPTRELHLPAWLELEGIPYTGAGPQAIILCYDKQIVRAVAEALGVDVPKEAFLPAGQFNGPLPDIYPALLKPNQADGSVGITKDAVVETEKEARNYLNFLSDILPGRDVLWQEYLPGPEYGVGVIGNPNAGFKVLPPLEVDFSNLPDGLAPILSFESKTDPDSPYWTTIGFRAAEVDESVKTKMADWAKMLFRRLDLRDYGRFDFRCGADGRPKMLETNPNPAWGYDGKLAFMAGFAGMSYAEMLDAIVSEALKRTGQVATR